MIRGSIINSQRIKGGQGFSNSGIQRFKNSRITSSIAIQSIQSVLNTTSYPSGYRLPKALLFPLKNGSIGGRTNPIFTTTVNILGLGYITSTISVTFTVSASANLLADIFGSVNVTFTETCEILGRGFISGSATVSASPSASDIAGEVFATNLEGDYSFRDLIKLMSAVSFGKSTIVDLGGGIATVTFRDVNDTENRVVADMTNSERTTITKTL